MTAAAERFTAWTPCPSCGRVECHALRAPRPDADAQALYRSVFLQMKGVLPDHVPEQGPEMKYEVIRTCRCGHEWGQV